MLMSPPFGLKSVKWPVNVAVAAMTGNTIVVDDPRDVCANAAPEPSIEHASAMPTHFGRLLGAGAELRTALFICTPLESIWLRKAIACPGLRAPRHPSERVDARLCSTNCAKTSR